MAHGVPHSDATRAAVLAALLAGQGIDTVAHAFGLSPATVREWRAAAGSDDGAAGWSPEELETISRLLLDYLRAALVTLTAAVRAVRDPAWLAQQSAADLAVLHGVLFDTAVRLLAALEPSAVEGEA